MRPLPRPTLRSRPPRRAPTPARAWTAAERAAWEAAKNAEPADALPAPIWAASTPRVKRPENVDGQFHVDSRCISCDTCRRLAPASFASVGPQSAVVSQPATPAEMEDAFRAMASCPT